MMMMMMMMIQSLVIAAYIQKQKLKNTSVLKYWGQSKN